MPATTPIFHCRATQEANHARLEHDHVVERELEELEEEGVHLAAELGVWNPFADSVEDDRAAAVASWRLSSVPAALTKELDGYRAYRAEPLNRFRDGSAVVDVTVGNDRATVLRFLGWLAAEKGISPGLGVFAKPTLGEWVEAYLQALQNKGLKYSSMAVGLTSLKRNRTLKPSPLLSPAVVLIHFVWRFPWATELCHYMVTVTM